MEPSTICCSEMETSWGPSIFAVEPSILLWNLLNEQRQGAYFSTQAPGYGGRSQTQCEK